MARRSSLNRNRQISEINMTPLLDLTFLLLITFIITVPLIEQGIQIRLPKGKASAMEQPNTCSITVDDQGTLFLDNIPITEDVLAEEKKIALALMDSDPKMASKPAQVKEKIVMGKMNKFYEENCLLQMEFVRSDLFQGTVERYILITICSIFTAGISRAVKYLSWKYMILSQSTGCGMPS